MILGIGSDLCNIERIASALERHGQRFEQRVFTPAEQEKANARPFTRAGTYAKRFAAKEAFAKAIGTGFGQCLAMTDIGVINTASGAPALSLNDTAQMRLDAMTPPGHKVIIHLTLTDDHPWAQAFLIIEAVPL